MNVKGEISMNGWIKFHREIITSPFWSKATAVQKVIIVTLLCMASRTSRQWIYKGVVYNVKPGQLITSAQSLIKLCGDKDVTRQKIRTALEYLKKCGFLTYETTSTHTLITIVNWDALQGNAPEYNQAFNQVPTKCQPSDAQNVTTNNNNIKNYNNYKNYNNSGYCENKKLSFSNYTQEIYTDEEIEKMLRMKEERENNCM